MPDRHFPGESAPRVDVILLNYNGWRDSLECLESLARMDYPAYRTIVCDNASTNDSWRRLVAWADGAQLAEPAPNPALHALSSPAVPKPIPYAAYDRTGAECGDDAGNGVPLVFIQSGANLGFSGGNNIALQFMLRGSAQYALLLNNDTVIAPDAVREMVRFAEANPRLGAVGATMLEYRNPDVVEEAAGGTVTRWHGRVRSVQRGARRGGTTRPRRLDYISGGCVLVRRSVIEQVGLLDERYFLYAEDIDWSVRIRAAGFELGYCPSAELWHKGGGSTVWRSPVSDYHNVKSSLLFVHKHHKPLVPLALAYSVYRCMLPQLVRGRWTRLRSAIRGIRDFAREAWRLG